MLRVYVRMLLHNDKWKLINFSTNVIFNTELINCQTWNFASKMLTDDKYNCFILEKISTKYVVHFLIMHFLHCLAKMQLIGNTLFHLLQLRKDL